jgi:hypothetical protein
VATCPRCRTKVAREEFVSAWSCCKECVRARQARALSNYNIATSEQTVETPYGWANALCLLGDPVEWLCWHIHGTKQEAQVCMAELLDEGRGQFPVR